MKYIYLDESGFTGTNWLSRDQPYFIVSSLCLEETEAQEWASLLLKSTRAVELKFSRLVKWNKSRNTLLEYARAIESRLHKVRFQVVHKRYALLAKLLDAVLEPHLHCNGLNFYADGYNLALANMLYISAAKYPELLEEVLGEFQQLCRKPDCHQLDSLRRAVVELTWESESIKELCAGLLRAIEWQLDVGVKEADKSCLELHVTAVLSLIRQWNQDVSEDITLIADHSKQLTEGLDLFAAVSDSDLPSIKEYIAHREVGYPIRLASIHLIDSRESIGVQLADVTAGLVNHVLMASENRSRSISQFTEPLSAMVMEWPRILQVVPHGAVTPKELGREGFDGQQIIHATMAALAMQDLKSNKSR